MTPHPKYYLADVPHDLRRRVLDLCFKRLWHEGLELLNQNGFHHYDRDDLMNFYSWAPTFLPEPVQKSEVGDQKPEQQIAEVREKEEATDNTPHQGTDSLSAPATHDGQRPSDNQLQLQAARQRLVHLLSLRATDASANSLSAASASVTPDLRPPTSEPVPVIHDPASLLTDLRDIVNRFVILPEMAAETLALWVVHTYAFTLREVTTYIGIVSPEKRCGKTTLLELLGSLAHEAVAAANISSSALFRVIEETQPTLLIDEADTFVHARDEMAGILNAGYRKGNAYVVRAAEGNARKNGLLRYSCWCPKVMAAIGRLPDTLADRCIVITMQRKMPGEKCDRLRELDPAQYRQRCADFVQQHRDAIAKARPDIPSALNDRAGDIWEPLLAIADLAGGEWPALARRAAEELSAAYDDDITLMGYLLKDIRNYMVFNDLDRVLSRRLVTLLNPRHDRPWEDLRRGRDINEWWLGHRMSALGIRSRMIRLGDVTGKGYMLADVDAAFRRYVPNAEAHGA